MSDKKYVADQDYYANTNPLKAGARGQALDAGDPAASFFLVAKGCALPADLAARFGLPRKPVEAKPEAKKEPEPLITAPDKPKAASKRAKK